MWSKVTLMNKHKIQWKSIREPSLDNQNLPFFARCDAPQPGLQLFLHRFLKDKITETFTALCSPSWAYVPEMTLIHCLHTRRGGKQYTSKLLHPKPMLSTATPSYPEQFSTPISKSVLVFLQASGFLSKTSGGGLAAPASLPRWGAQAMGACCTNGHIWTLNSNTCSAQFQTLLPRNAHVCSLDMQPLLKALFW